MQKIIAAMLAAVLLLCAASAATAGVYGHYVSEEDGAFLIVMQHPISDALGGVYIGSPMYLMSLSREEQDDGTTRIFTPLSESSAIIDLLLRYEDDSQQAVLVSGDIARFDNEGEMMEEQSMLAMQDVRFIRQEVPAVTALQGTRWLRYSMTISGSERAYPFDGSVIEFFDTDDQTGQIPDNALRTYPFTYEPDGDALVMHVEAGDEITDATVQIDSNVLVVTIENSVLYFLPETL